MRRKPINEFLRFCIVGGLAFIVDACMLELGVALGLPALIARILSIALALQCSFLLHHAFTYRVEGGYRMKQWRAFMASNLIGAAINYAIFAGVLRASLSADMQTSRLIALAAGTSIALFFNHWANRRYVFADKGP